MQNKYFRLIIGVIVLVLVVVGLSRIKVKQNTQPKASDSNTTTNKSQVAPAEYIGGAVTKVSADKIDFKVPSGVDAKNRVVYKTLTALVSAQTKVIKQVVTQPGNQITLVAGKLSDIKVGSQIFTLKAGSESGTYTPATIQIIK
jgi:uncharacterized alpha/beta hydrolase family protein